MKVYAKTSTRSLSVLRNHCIPAFIYYVEELFKVYHKHGYPGNPMATVFVPIKPLYIIHLLNTLGIKKFNNR